MQLNNLRASDITGARFADLFDQLWIATENGTYPAMLTLDYSTGEEQDGDLVPQIHLALRRVVKDPANPPAPETTA